MAARARVLTGPQELAYVRQRAVELGDDPNAVVAVGYAEGGFPGAVGDRGTSFGPFQLHQGGALPAGLSGSSAATWANAKAGLNYALQKITAVAKGLVGMQAVDAIVTGFEKPADGGAGDERRAANYLLERGVGAPSRAANIRWTGASTAGVRPALLASIGQAVKAVGGIGVLVTSGKRAPGAGNDVPDSNHITGDAVDGYVIFSDGRRVPLGEALKPVAGRFGLRSGAVAGFDPAKPGGYDPVHVDDGANLAGAQQPSVVRARPDGSGGGGGGALSWLGDAAGDSVTAAEKGFESLYTGSGISGIADVFKGAIWLLRPQSWLRMVEFVTGMLMMLFGLIGFGVVFAQRSPAVGAAAGVAAALPGPVGAAGKAVTAVRTPRQSARRHVQARARRQRDEQDEYFRDRADELDERRRHRRERQLAEAEQRGATRARAQASDARARESRRAQGHDEEFGF